MSEMGDWIDQLHMRIPEGPGMKVPLPPGTDTGTLRVPDPAPADPLAEPPPVVPPPAAPGPTLDPKLRMWLLAQQSGSTALTDEMYDYYKGDDILRQVQQFDPNARWVPTALGGGESGNYGVGHRLEFEGGLLPKVGGPGGGKTIFDSGLVPVYDDSQLHNGSMVYNDPYYGPLTPMQNVKKQGNILETALPFIGAAISLGGPALAGSLAAAGIGAGAATGAVTGSGVAAGAGASPWWSSWLGKAPSIARGIGSATHDYGGGEWAPPIGGTPKTTTTPAPTGDSSLVANNFADDPYGFSRRGF